MTILRDLWAVLTGRLSTRMLEIWMREAKAYENMYVKAATEREVVRAARDTAMFQLLAADEEVFRMSQCGSWDQMQPIFARLREQAEARRRHVSNSIGKREIARIREEFRHD